MTDLESGTASGASGRLDLFTTALATLVTTEGGFVIFGCKDNPDIYIQFAWGPPVLCFEVSGAGASPALTDYLFGLGFAPPDGASVNFSRELDDPEPIALAAMVEEIFLDGFGCPPAYLARIDELEID